MYVFVHVSVVDFQGGFYMGVIAFYYGCHVSLAATRHLRHGTHVRLLLHGDGSGRGVYILNVYILYLIHSNTFQIIIKFLSF